MRIWIVPSVLVALLLGGGGCDSSSSGTDPGVDASLADTAVPGPDASAVPDAEVVFPDGCVPAVCQAGQCGALEDGCGGSLDCGGCANLGETCGGAGVPNECGPPFPILHAEPGCFLDMVDTSSEWEISVGGGVTYSRMAIEYDTVHGGWRTDLYSREVLNHGLFGFTRDVSFFPGRYILGNAAQIHPAHPTLDRKSVFYGRIDLEEKPPGEGWTGYTSWRDDFPWTEGETYHVFILLDAVAQEQILEIYHTGQQVLQRIGPIPYFDPSLTTVSWTARFGGEESTDREVKPVGWQFCNLLIRGEEL
ncbi:MAG: hypothetical protein ABI333_17185 [bacterium]